MSPTKVVKMVFRSFIASLMVGTAHRIGHRLQHGLSLINIERAHLGFRF